MENSDILLIDDEAAYHGIVGAILRRFDVAVDCFCEPAAALEALNHSHYELILLDIALGTADGHDVVAALRASISRNSQNAVIAFTAHKPPGGADYFIGRGFDGWLPKPFTAGDLLRTVRRWCGDDRIRPANGAEGQHLTVLLGEAEAKAMVDRLHEGLAEGVAAIDAGADPSALGHRLGGLAGTLGFPVLCAAWLSLQHDGAAWPTVRALTIEAIARRRGASEGG